MAENLCLGFGCQGKGFFAKVSTCGEEHDLQAMKKDILNMPFFCFANLRI